MVTGTSTEPRTDGVGAVGDAGPGGPPGSEALPPLRAWLPVVGAVLVRPRLWWTAVRQLFALAPHGWWRRWPLLPLPDPAYLRFRLVTAYGRADHRPDPEDLVAYLSWCRDWRRAGWGGRRRAGR